MKIHNNSVINKRSVNLFKNNNRECSTNNNNDGNNCNTSTSLYKKDLTQNILSSMHSFNKKNDKHKIDFLVSVLKECDSKAYQKIMVLQKVNGYLFKQKKKTLSK